VINSTIPRLGTTVAEGIIEKMTQPVYQVLYRKVMAEFSTNYPEQLFFSLGRPKIQGTFPCVGVEITRREDPWGAISHTKDVKVHLELIVAIKTGTGQKDLETPTGSIGDFSGTEKYIVALSELIYEILNEPLTLQYTISQHLDGSPVTPPLQVYDSKAELIDYGYLYNGALRIAKIPWFGSLMRLGPSGGSGFFNPPT